MNNDPDPKANSAGATIVWLMLGLAPIVIILCVLSSNHPLSVAVFLICGLFNLLGGFGCVRNTQNKTARFFLGLFLSGCFFVMCVFIGVFGACICSMNSGNGF